MGEEFKHPDYLHCHHIPPRYLGCWGLLRVPLGAGPPSSPESRGP